jgi:hypothetical protein
MSPPNGRSEERHGVFVDWARIPFAETDAARAIPLENSSGRVLPKSKKSRPRQLLFRVSVSESIRKIMR